MFTLAYPAESSPTSIVTLRSPNLGNKERIVTKGHTVSTRTGYLRATQLASRPEVYRFIYTFIIIECDPSNPTVEDFEDFIETTLGLEIKITDHDDTERIGLIISDPIEIITIKDLSVYEVSFEFQERVS